MLWTIFILAVISLLLSEWGWRRNPSANFYLAPSRVWELFSGSIAAFIVQKQGVQKNDILAFIGLAAIVFSILSYDETTPFPSVYTLVPVIGVLLLVLYAEKRTIAAKILSTKLFVGIGLISYSAYLWHQPLFAFARLKLGEVPSLALMGGLSLVSLVLAILSWKYIETPFRNKNRFSRTQVFLFSIVGILLLSLIGLGGHLSTKKRETNYLENLNPYQQQIHGLRFFAKRKDKDFVAEWRYGKCFYGSEFDDFQVFDKDECLSPVAGAKNVLLFGDSHAAQWYPGLRKNFPNINFLQATASGCRPLLSTVGEKRCTDLRDYVYREFLENNKIDAIILAARWKADEIEASFADTLSLLKRFTDRVIVLGPVAEHRPTIIDQILSNNFERSIANFSSSEAFTYVDKERIRLSQRVAELADQNETKFISVTALQCFDEKCRITTPSGMPFAFDYGHLTLDGSETLVQEMKLINDLLSNIE